MNMNRTEIVFILDRSGSMSGFEKDTIGGYNAFLDRQRADPAHETIVTTVLFDDKYEVLHSGLPVHEILPMTEYEYFTRGSTALLDAVGRSIECVGSRLSKTPEPERPGQVMFVITTDGYENASRKFNRQQVRDMITHQRVKYSWEFIFLGADIAAEEVAGEIGISAANALSYQKNSESIGQVFFCMSENVTNAKQSGSLNRNWKAETQHALRHPGRTSKGRKGDGFDHHPINPADQTDSQRSCLKDILEPVPGIPLDQHLDIQPEQLPDIQTEQLPDIQS